MVNHDAIMERQAIANPATEICVGFETILRESNPEIADRIGEIGVVTITPNGGAGYVTHYSGNLAGMFARYYLPPVEQSKGSSRSEIIYQALSSIGQPVQAMLFGNKTAGTETVIGTGANGQPFRFNYFMRRPKGNPHRREVEILVVDATKLHQEQQVVNETVGRVVKEMFTANPYLAAFTLQMSGVTLLEMCNPRNTLWQASPPDSQQGILNKVASIGTGFHRLVQNSVQLEQSTVRHDRSKLLLDIPPNMRAALVCQASTNIILGLLLLEQGSKVRTGMLAWELDQVNQQIADKLPVYMIQEVCDNHLADLWLNTGTPKG